MRAGPPDTPFFVVGCPRSGTTLVREILDGHPRLAVVNESHFIMGVAPRPWRRRRRVTVEDLLEHPRAHRWEVDPEEMRRCVVDAGPTTDGFGDVIDAVLRAYATCRGKVRWGDKTPGYVSYVAELARWFPTAQFVHVIRDGREVAASLAERPWGSRSPTTGAFWWVHKVRAGRAAGRRLGRDRYLEIRLEDLTADPATTVGELCDFLGEEPSASMLDYPDRLSRSGRPLVSQERHLRLPPTSGLRHWRDGMSAREAASVEAVCHRTLADLGYEPGPITPPAYARAVAVRARDLAFTARSDIRKRLNPRVREF